jgi:RNA polymerase sigma-70 factor (ECF subfamily)
MTHIQFYATLLGQQESLLFYAKNLTSDTDNAQDLLQETMLKALTYRDKFNQDTNLKAWVFTIMRNTFINNYRRNRCVKKVFETTNTAFHFKIEHDKGYPSPESIYSSKEITKGINALEDAYKIPLNMYIEGFKYIEIAEELKLPLGTVKNRIFSSRKKLEKSLKEFNY